MTPAERQALESAIEKHTRRGELAEACHLLRLLVEAFPDEAAFTQRLEGLEQSLHPSERRAFPLPKVATPLLATSAPQRAEALAAEGKFAEAIAIYRVELARRPDAPLLKERLDELFVLAQVSGRSRPQGDRESTLLHLLERVRGRRRK